MEQRKKRNFKETATKLYKLHSILFFVMFNFVFISFIEKRNQMIYRENVQKYAKNDFFQIILTIIYNMDTIYCNEEIQSKNLVFFLFKVESILAPILSSVLLVKNHYIKF